MSSQPGSMIWQQVDHTLANLMLAEVTEEFRQLAHKDLQQIHYHNIGNGNGMTVPSERLEMHRLRTDELAARYYAVYCEVWRAQQKALTPEFLRAICPSRLQGLMSARVGGVSSEFSMEQARTHSPNGEWLNSAMAEFRRSMHRLYAKWERLAEIDAKGLEHMLAAAPNNPEVDSVATQVVNARIQLRIVETRIASIEARIASCERALSATQLRQPDNYRIKTLAQHLEDLKADKKQLEARRDHWQLSLNTTLSPAAPEHTEIMERAAAVTIPVFSHSDTYDSITFKGQSYTLQERQAAIIRLLHEALKKGHPAVPKRKLLSIPGCEDLTLVRDIFKSRPQLWGELIVNCEETGEGRGFYRLHPSIKE